MRLLNWANQFEVCCFLDNHHYNSRHHSYECVVAAGVDASLLSSPGNAYEQLNEFSRTHRDWIFGHLSYDLKNETEQLTSSNSDGIGFPNLFFFVPRIVILLNGKEMSVGILNSESAGKVYEQVMAHKEIIETGITPVTVQNRFSREEYISANQQIKRHIARGDCYEVNFCQEFFAENIVIDPLRLYVSLSKVSPNPFAAFYKDQHLSLCCASPERYIKKQNNKLISQPMKGTGARNHQNHALDNLYRNELFQSNKERTENVMVVDLVRNDLSKVCEEGSVVVDELFGIYSYPQVHQMVSTISGTLRQGLAWSDVIEASFPMGSMTGVPKKRVMQLIEKYEKTKRGLFSGSIGYVTPDGDFDFNVVIRSILYNRENQYLSYQVGSAITFSSDPEKEYDECMLKAAAIIAILS